MATYKSNSPYAITEQVENYLDIWNPPNVPSSISDQQIEITSEYENRPDLLSNDLYGTPRFWWVFAVRNPNIIKDPIYDLVAGKIIYIPNMD